MATYSSAGVNLAAAARAKQRIGRLARTTFNSGVLADIGGFGGLFRVPRGRWRDPVLVSSCDGVGTKLKIAFLTGRHNTVGADLVNHCVNDIAVCGAEPLFFLDYLATGRLDPQVAVEIVGGLSAACRANGCALVGGETAQMPGFYSDGEYDLAGFIVGAVERREILGEKRVRLGDLLVGIPSTGLHTNGYSLARKLLLEQQGLAPGALVPEIDPVATVADVLLRVHRSYLELLGALRRKRLLSAAAHITGGGITGNVPRVLPAGMRARIDLASWIVPPLFEYLRLTGKIRIPEMLRTFNMGIGLVLIVPKARYREAARLLDRLAEQHILMGKVVSGRRGVDYQ